MRIDNKGNVGKVIADTYVVQFNDLLLRTNASTRHEQIPAQYKRVGTLLYQGGLQQNMYKDMYMYIATSGHWLAARYNLRLYSRQIT